MPEISHARYRAGEGEPLVLVHGFTATWRCWLPVIAELVPRFEVIAPTLHGHDGGPQPAPGDHAHSIADAADHLERLLDDLGVDDAHFAGNSMGGTLSLELAKRGRARSVVALSPGGGRTADNDVEIERIIALFTRSNRIAKATLPRVSLIMRRPGPRKLALRDVMARGDQVPAFEAEQLVRSSVRCAVIDDVFAAMRDGTATLTGLEQVTCPTLVAWGERDRILPLARHAPYFRAEIPGVEFRTLPRLGHTPMWDDPSLIATTIGNFAAAAAAPTAEPVAAS